MRSLSGRLFHENKLFSVKFIGPNLFFPWLLVLSHLTDVFVLVLFHVIYTTYIHILYISFLDCFIFYYFFAVILLFPCSTEEILSSLYHYYMLALVIP